MVARLFYTIKTMKNKFFKFMGIAMMAMLCFTFSSCGDDDDEKGGGNSNSNTSNGLSGYYTFTDYYVESVQNNWYDDDGEVGGYVFLHIIDNNTIERGMMHANKNPQSNAVFTKNIAGTTLYFVVDYLDWVCKYTYSDGALYVSNGDIYTIYNGKIYSGDGLQVEKL